MGLEALFARVVFIQQTQVSLMLYRSNAHFNVSGRVLLFLFSIAQCSNLISQTPDTTASDLEILGAGVLTPLLKSQAISGAADIFTAKAGTWQYRITSGTGVGTVVIERLLNTTGPSGQLWRRNRDPGHITDFSIIENSIQKVALTDPAHKMLFNYTPGETEIPASIDPGQSVQASYQVQALSTATPGKTEAGGAMAVTLTYLGQYQVATPAGSFTAYGIKKVLSGKIGPVQIATSLYAFYSPGVGEVARVDHTDAHAMLLYNQDTRTGYLLNKLPVFDN